MQYPNLLFQRHIFETLAVSLASLNVVLPNTADKLPVVNLGKKIGEVEQGIMVYQRSQTIISQSLATASVCYCCCCCFYDS